MLCSRKFDGRRTGVAAAFGSRRDGNDGAKVTQGAVFAVGKVRETLALLFEGYSPEKSNELLYIDQHKPLRPASPQLSPLSTPTLTERFIGTLTEFGLGS